MILQITEPIGGSFDVVIKNSGGTTVYSATHGNETFDPAITTAGDYTMYIDGEETPVYCFTISACECPPFLSASVSTPNDVFYYFNIEFDLSDWEFCPFSIYVESIGYFSATYDINTLADLSFVSSDLGRKTTLIGGRTDIYYRVQLLDSEATFCYDGYVYAPEVCVAPVPVGSYSLGLIGGTTNGCFFNYNSADCGSFTCNGLTINYLQTNAGIVGTPDSGSIPITDVCATYPTGSISFPITPNTSYPAYTGNPLSGSGRARYSITIENCCGTIFNGNTP